LVGGEMVKVVRERTGIALVVGGRVGNGEACGVWCVHVHAHVHMYGCRKVGGAAPVRADIQ
jgi:hypothetical protein